MRTIGLDKTLRYARNARRIARGAALIRVAKTDAKRLIRAGERASGRAAVAVKLEIGADARMQTTDSNKIALALLGTLLATMALGVFSNAIYAPTVLKAGYELPTARPRRRRRQAGRPPRSPLPDPARQGRCREGRGRRQGLPDLPQFRQGRRRQGRPAAVGRRRPSRRIGRGLRLFRRREGQGGDWTYEDINKFITKPSAYVAGTKMSFPGESDPQEARRHPRLFADAVGQPGPVPEIEPVSRGQRGR